MFTGCYKDKHCCGRSEDERSYLNQQRANSPVPEERELCRRCELHVFVCGLTFDMRGAVLSARRCAVLTGVPLDGRVMRSHARSL